jgi:hypothetical protein
MRSILFVFLCLAAACATAQTTIELTAQYGPPESESYQVADGVTLTVTYGKDRQACQILLQPRPASNTSIPSNLVDKLVDQLVPPRDRKGKPLRMAQQSGCASAISDQYENVSITRSSNDCAPKDEKVQSLTIQWTRPDCVSTLQSQQTQP